MKKIVSVINFKDENKYIIYPYLIVKDSGSIARPPYVIEYTENIENLLDKILYTLEFSSEGTKPKDDLKTINKDFLKGLGIKTRKALYHNSISLNISLIGQTLTFYPTQNQGMKGGFNGLPENMSISLAFNSTRHDIIEALKLALSRCT